MDQNTIESTLPEDQEEPLLQPDVKRLLLLPIIHDDLWRMYKQAEASFWTAEEIDMSNDYADWQNKLNDDERHFISHVLAFFAGSDGIVNENLITRFSREVQQAESRSFYAFQQTMENIHCVAGDTYVLTSRGYHQIKDLEDQNVNVWNGNEFTRTTVKLTSDSAELLRVTLSNGMQLRCTTEHKFLMEDAENAAAPRPNPGWFARTFLGRTAEEKDETAAEDVEEEDVCGKFVYARNLCAGDVVAPYKLPIVQEDDPLHVYMHCPALQGAYAAIGDTTPGYLALPAAGNHEGFDVLPAKFDPVTAVAYYSTKDLEERFFVPLDAPATARLAWLSTLIDIAGEETRFGISINMAQLDFLRRVQLLATTLGARPAIDAGRQSLLFDERSLRIIYGRKLGFALLPKQPLRIESVERSGEIEPTYCFTESERGLGTFNGIVTGNSETYGLLLQTLIRDGDKKRELLRGIQDIPNIRKKADWAFRYIDSKTATFAQRLVGFACVEGIFFSSSFASIFWVKKRGLLPGVTFSNELISRDEALHVEFAALLYNQYVKNKLSDEAIHKIVGEAVEVEMDFVCDALPVRLIGMNSDLMCQYVRFVADRLLTSLGHPKLYKDTNPFDFMENLSMEGKSNFFERVESTYSKAGVMGGGGEGAHVFKMDMDF